MQREHVGRVHGVFVRKHLFGSDTQITFVYFRKRHRHQRQEGKKGCLPKHLSVHGARVEFQIAPSGSGVVTFVIGTVEPEEDERFFHHVLCLEEDGQFGVFVGDRVGGVGRKLGIR